MSLKTKLSVYRKIAVSMVFFLVLQLIHPATLHALTSGPVQPEFTSFEPVNTTEMVNLFTGDFTYNIPLFELPGPNGGYPFNLAYHSGAQMDTEASWVGLSWTLNAGALNRQMRGLPDDFDGSAAVDPDEITFTQSIKDNWSVGLGVKTGLEAIGQTLLSLDGSVYYNRYKGFGYSKGLGLSHQFDGGASVGIGLNFDSQTGLDLTPKIGIRAKKEKIESKEEDALGLSASLGFNNRHGLTSINLSLEKTEKELVKAAEQDSEGNETKAAVFDDGRQSSRPLADLTFAYDGHLPAVSLPWVGSNFELELEPGAFPGLFANIGTRGYYNHQAIRNKGIPVKVGAYGYLNLENSRTPYGVAGISDFNREKDGQVTKNTPNLASPFATFDIYSSLGQGIGGQFRPYRDFGVFSDRTVNSRSEGKSLGIDFGAGHLGGAFNVNNSNSISGMWVNENNFVNNHEFKANVENSTYESFYFKNTGEYTAEEPEVINQVIGGERAMRVNLNQQSATNTLSVKTANGLSTLAGFTGKRSKRKSRNLSSIQFTNKELMNNGSSVFEENAMPNFNLMYLDASGVRKEFNADKRAHLPGHHFGGFQTITSDGLRYNYGLPAYNKVHEDYLFSVESSSALGCGPLIYPNSHYSVNGDGEPIVDDLKESDRYFHKKEIPQYAHSYLLTSLQGADYVDKGTPGFGIEDDGYWVNFEYQNVHSNFKWRAPYIGASVDRGIRLRASDDKGSFSYGEKEIWYTHKVETASHVALFHLSDREDGKEAISRNPSVGSSLSNAASLKKLDKITIYTRAEYGDGTSPGSPMKEVHFKYNYSICPGVLNNENAGGKLTLEKIWFTNEESTRGSLNPYQFFYNNEDVNINHGYENNRSDRWGYYKPLDGTDECSNTEFSYVKQFNEVDEEDFYLKQKDNATAWNLTRIVLPSGAEMSVEYERKDYGYVQDRVAGQMMKISTDLSGNPTSSLDENDNPVLHFDLEKPIAAGDEALFENYFEDLHLAKAGNGYKKQLYFKIKSNIKRVANPSLPLESEFAVISGYHNIDSYQLGSLENGEYKTGKIFLEKAADPSHHPFKLATFQFLKTDLSDLAYGNLESGDDDPESSSASKKKKLLSLVGFLPSILQVFTGINGYFNLQKRGHFIIPNDSFVRLCSPDKKKYGGGARVRQITLNDNWTNQTSTLGQVYEYTAEDDQGNTISSGVAAYEPLIGGDENSLKYAKSFVAKTLPLRTNNNLFTELPINESYYPGPQIGFSKVTVKALATYLKEIESLPEGMLGTGKEEHEFYTAKDFPVISEETLLEREQGKNEDNLYIPIPLVGRVKHKKLAVSQGYATTLNNMHGKPKKVSSYAQAKNGGYALQPFSWIEYNYHQQPKVLNGRRTNELVNTVDVLTEYKIPQGLEGGIPLKLPVEPLTVGVDYEAFADMVEHETISTNGGGDVNGEIFVLFGFPDFAVNYTNTQTRLRKSVVNKIIHKSGILKSIRAFDGSSLITTENLVFDKQTGQPLLTSVNNNYDDKIFEFKVPAHMVYEGTGAAYENLGIEFKATPGSDEFGLTKLEGINYAFHEVLVEGDEFLVNENSRATFVKKNGDDFLFDIEDDLITSEAYFKLIRSGKRNQLTTTVGSITSLGDPTKSLTTSFCANTLDGPNLEGSTEQVLIWDNKDLYVNEIERLNYALSKISNEGCSYKVNLESQEFLNLFGYLPEGNHSSCTLSSTTALGVHTDGNLFNFASQINDCFGRSAMSVYDLSGVNSNITDYFSSAVDIDKFDVNSIELSNSPLASVEIDVHGNVSGTPTIQRLRFRRLWHCLNPEYHFETRYVDPSTLNCNGSNVSSSLLVMDSVLTSSATRLSDVWKTNEHNRRINIDYPALANDYGQGHKGIWRPYESFVYTDQRTQEGEGMSTANQSDIDTLMAAPLNLRHDGVMNNVPLFNWEDPVGTICDDSWRLVQTNTKYNPTNQLETRDALGNYSAGLYGYSDYLPVAVAANAGKSEIAYEGFEEYAQYLGTGQSDLDLVDLNTADVSTPNGQFSFHPSNGSAPTYIDYEIKYGNGAAVLLDLAPGQTLYSNPYDMYVTMFRNPETSGIDEGPTVQRYRALIGETLMDCPSSGEVSLRLEFPDCDPNFVVDEIWDGRITIERHDHGINGGLGFSPATPDLIKLSKSKAHTGDMSLKFEAGADVELNLYALNLIQNKEYVFSVWIGAEAMNTFNYEQYFSHLQMMGTNTGNEGFLTPKSPIIDGWQLFEGRFKPSAVIDKAGIFKVIVENFGVHFYFDDFRIYPVNASMQSYVYDPENYRLQATLDENNFATFYHYQPDGTLSLIQKETEAGRMTIQETQAYIKSTQ